MTYAHLTRSNQPTAKSSRMNNTGGSTRTTRKDDTVERQGQTQQEQVITYFEI